MNLSQLYYFRRLAELQHYTKAAKELFITQPALSDAIRSLEKELGVPLFRREGRNVRLTREGAEFSEYVHNALRELDKGIAVMRERTGGLSGDVRIGGVYPVCGDYLPALIRAYQQSFGDEVSLTVGQGFSLGLIDDLKADRYDVVFAAYKPGEKDLAFEPVLTHQLVVGVRRDSPLARRGVVSLEDLRGYEVYTYRAGIQVGDEVAQVLAPHGIEPHQEFDDEITLCGMVSTSDRPDVCGVFTYTIGVMPFTDLALLPIDESEVPTDFHVVYMVYKKDEFKSRVLESFLDFAAGFRPPEDAVPRLATPEEPEVPARREI